MRVKRDTTTVIVIGMHRSGTSMIAGILYHLGVFMGENLMVGDMPQQPHGYYEDREIISLNERLLTACKGSWDYPPPSISLPDDHELIEEMERLIESRERVGKGKFWGWKDPRTVLTLPLYLPRLTGDVKIICMKRNRDQVIESLHKREKNRTREWAEEIHDIYMRHIQANLRGLDVLYLDYSTVIRPLKITPVVKIISFLGLVPNHDQIKRAIDHIQPRQELVNA